MSGGALLVVQVLRAAGQRSFIARPVGLALTGPVAELVGFRTWLLVVGAVIVASVLVALTSRDVRRLERNLEVPVRVVA